MGADLYLVCPEMIETNRTIIDMNFQSMIFVDASPARLETFNNRDCWDVVATRLQKAMSTYHQATWYFRDSYNETSLLWRINMSWWQDIPCYLGKSGYDPNRQLSQVNESIIVPHSAVLLLARIEQSWREQTLTENAEYFEEKYQRLTDMLRRSAREQLIIEASI